MSTTKFSSCLLAFITVCLAACQSENGGGQPSDGGSSDAIDGQNLDRGAGGVAGGDLGGGTGGSRLDGSIVPDTQVDSGTADKNPMVADRAANDLDVRATSDVSAAIDVLATSDLRATSDVRVTGDVSEDVSSVDTALDGKNDVGVDGAGKRDSRASLDSAPAITCGSTVCADGYYCCDRLNNLCAPIGAGCIQGVGGGLPSCTGDSDCQLKSDYCDGCNCLALGLGETAPTCTGSTVACLMDPCTGRAAQCVDGKCTSTASR
jgi:hypothetical protein